MSAKIDVEYNHYTDVLSKLLIEVSSKPAARSPQNQGRRKLQHHVLRAQVQGMKTRARVHADMGTAPHNQTSAVATLCDVCANRGAEADRDACTFVRLMTWNSPLSMSRFIEVQHDILPANLTALSHRP